MQTSVKKLGKDTPFSDFKTIRKVLPFLGDVLLWLPQTVMYALQSSEITVSQMEFWDG